MTSILIKMIRTMELVLEDVIQLVNVKPCASPELDVISLPTRRPIEIVG